MSNRILITGANGAFGKLTVKKLLQEGHTVVASMRDPKGRNKLHANELESAGAYIVEIDVTNDDSVIQGINQALKITGGLDTVINNAGIGAFGIQENFTAEDWQAIFDVNVFGAQRMNRAVLPHMRERESGLLIHISSLIGRIVLPFWGAYCASKWALEALAETYRVELSKYGIDSCIVEPGPYPTTFFEGIMAASDESRNASYGNFETLSKQFFTDFGAALSANTAQNPQHIADAIVLLIDAPAGKKTFRTVVDTMGMGDPIEEYNTQHEKLTYDIYQAFGIDKVQTVS